MVIQLLFGGFDSKQVHLKLLGDGWGKNFGSATLEDA
jgi:hypothetical protein